MRTIILVAVLLAMAGPAKADTYTGDELLRDCKERQGSFHDGFCVGYIVANLQIGRGLGVRCAPPLEHQRSQRIVVDWLKSHPAALDLRASHLIALALDDAYPCKSSQPPAASPTD